MAHGDYLAYDRLEERRVRAARAALVAHGHGTPPGGRWQRLAGGVARVLRLLL